MCTSLKFVLMLKLIGIPSFFERNMRFLCYSDALFIQIKRFQQQQNLGRRFGTSKMHLSPPVAQAAVPSKAVVLLLLTFCLFVTPIVGVCNCSMFCCTLLIAIILVGKRELVALLNLSSWCLVMVEPLFLAVPRGCLRFVIVVFSDHTHLLFLRSKDRPKMCHFLNFYKFQIKTYFLVSVE